MERNYSVFWQELERINGLSDIEVLLVVQEYKTWATNKANEKISLGQLSKNEGQTELNELNNGG
jgi:hypothetical protein